MPNKKLNAILIFPRPLETNDRGMLSVIEKFRLTHELTICGLGIDNIIENVNLLDLYMGFTNRYLKAILTHNITLLPFIRFFFLLFYLKPAVVYVREIYFFPSLLPLKLLFFNTNFIFDIRENPNTFYKKQNFFLERFGKFIDTCWTNSPNLKELLNKNYFIKNVKAEYALPAKAFLKNISINNNLDLNKEAISICFFGEVKPDRKIEIAVEGVNLLCNHQTVDIYGKIRDEEYVAFLKDIDQNNRITFHGMIPYATAPDTLINYDCGILLNEINNNSNITIPGKLWEYTACGLCLISNSRPTVLNFIMDNKIGFIADTPAEFSKAITKLQNNKSTLSEYKENSQNFFCQTYRSQVGYNFPFKNL